MSARVGDNVPNVPVITAAVNSTRPVLDGPMPDPVRFLRRSWSTDPFALCSYSYLAPAL